MSSNQKHRNVRRIDEFFNPREIQKISSTPSDEESHNASGETTSTSSRVELDVAEQPHSLPITTASHSSQDLPTYPDIELLTQDELHKDETRRKILQGEWSQCHKFKFPSSCVHGMKRKLSYMYLVNYKWLRYSISNDSVCCAYCMLFGKEGAGNQTGTFSSRTQGFTDWSNIGRLAQHHDRSGAHFDALAKGDNFLRLASGAQRDICGQLSSQVQDTIERNRKILGAIIDVIVLCGQQNIALRGHSEKNSNFLSLLQFRAKTDPVLASHLQNSDTRAKYTSPRIQNELIEICGNVLRTALVSDCNKAPFYAFLADEATDSATMEEISICARFVHRKEDNIVEVREEFLGFVQAGSTKGEALARKFLETQQEYGIATNKMRAQGYDGAANMAGVHRGVQAIIRQSIPDAVYVHCKAHSLNLAIGHACKEP